MQREFVTTMIGFALWLGASKPISAQITWEQEYRGKTVSCGVSGMMGFGDDCGFENYDAAFVGKILSDDELPGDEFRLAVSPTEIFKGDLPAVVKITTRSGACMPEIRIGDEWLFSVKRDKESGEFLQWFGSGGPLAKSQKQVDKFRLLAHLNDSGVVAGEISDESLLGTRRAGQKVAVRSIADGGQHIAVSDAEGHFEFPPLPAGRYFIDPNTVPGMWSRDGGETTVAAHECRDYHIGMRVDGSVGGSVILPNGDTSRTWNIDAVPLDNSGSSAASAFTDTAGHFELRGLKKGRYLIGIEVVGVSSRYDLNFGVYAPGVRNRAAAQIIDLGNGEKRTGVDIHIPENALKVSGP